MTYTLTGNIAYGPPLAGIPNVVPNLNAPVPDTLVPFLQVVLIAVPDSHAGISGHGHKNWGSDYTSRAIFVRLLALTMMAIAIGMAVYAALNFRKRGQMLL